MVVAAAIEVAVEEVRRGGEGGGPRRVGDGHQDLVGEDDGVLGRGSEGAQCEHSPPAGVLQRRIVTDAGGGVEGRAGVSPRRQQDWPE